MQTDGQQPAYANGGSATETFDYPELSFWHRRLVSHSAGAGCDPCGNQTAPIPEFQVTPVIDRRYKLSEVPDAIRYLEEGHARGKVVNTVE